MPDEQQISEIVDEIADEIDPVRIENESERLEISAMDLINRVANELKMRVTRA